MQLQIAQTMSMAAALLLASACTPSNDEAEPESVAEQSDDAAMRSWRANCPMAAEDVKVEVSDTEAGVALSFTSSTGEVEDLRRRARHMAQMYEMHQGHRGMMWRHMEGERRYGWRRTRGRGGSWGMLHRAGPMPAVTASVEELEDGARVVLRPRDPEQLDALRERVREHHARMHAGECWMLEA